MRYSRKVASLCTINNLVQFLHVLCPKYITFCFQTLENGREDKNECTQAIFGFNNEIVYYITRGETERLHECEVCSARVKRGLQSHEMLSLCFVSSNVYYFS